MMDIEAELRRFDLPTVTRLQQLKTGALLGAAGGSTRDYRGLLKALAERGHRLTFFDCSLCAPPND